METKENVTQAAPDNHKRRKFWIIVATSVFVLCFVAYGLYWLFVARFQIYTDDAYVTGIQAPVIAQTTGNVTQVNYANTDLVKAGDVLVTLDDTNAQLLYEQAKHEFINTVRQTQVLYIDSNEYQAKINSNKILLSQSQKDYDRRVVLGRQDDISREALQHAKDSVELAQLQLDIATEQYNSNQALLHGVSLKEHPAVKQAADDLRQAWIALQRTKILSPITGYVARQNVQVGSQVSPSSPLMVIVPVEPVWIDANFKETQLQDIRIGQPVTVTSGLYGSSVTYSGTVVGINMGTGSAFSLLPAQNATGNWIKVVQRLPVRISLDSEQVKKYPLRIGLSMNVTIDSSNTDGAILAETQRAEPFYVSNALILNLDEINTVINDLINANAYPPLVPQEPEVAPQS